METGDFLHKIKNLENFPEKSEKRIDKSKDL